MDAWLFSLPARVLCCSRGTHLSLAHCCRHHCTSHPATIVTRCLGAGWTGGPYGVGYRFKLRHTRAIVNAIHSGELGAAEYETMPTFNLQVQCGRGLGRGRFVLHKAGFDW
jgi:hypothetical protein